MADETGIEPSRPGGGAERATLTGLPPREIGARTLVGVPTFGYLPTGIAPRAPVDASLPDVTLKHHDLPATLDPRLFVLADPRGSHAAAIRALRHRLVERGNPRCVLVTSASPGEGKTLVAANLALALAEPRRHRVLLLEANARAPSLARLFGIGLDQPSDLLGQLAGHRKEPEAPWTVIALEPPRLHVLAIDPAAAESMALDAPLLARAVRRLRALYDYVVIDGPPVIGGPEVDLLADATDGVLVTAQERRSRARHVREALEHVAPTAVLGLVMLEG